jgi:hypothetical protein
MALVCNKVATLSCQLGLWHTTTLKASFTDAELCLRSICAYLLLQLRYCRCGVMGPY